MNAALIFTGRSGGWRRWRWCLLAMGGSLGLAGAITLFGWRWGFSALPEIVPGGEGGPLPATRVRELTASNCWYWIRELSAQLAGDPTDIRTVYPPLVAWCMMGQRGLTNEADLRRWLADRSAIERCYQAARRCPESHPPEGATLGRTAALDAQYGKGNLLIYYPLWLATEAERRGASAEAFDRLLEAWEMHQRIYLPFETLRPMEGRLAALWRRLTLQGPGLTPEQARQVLTRLQALTNGWNSLERSFRPVQQAAHLAESKRPRFPNREDWDDLWDEFRGVTGGLIEDAQQLDQWLMRDFLRGSARPPSLEGGRRFLAPLQVVWDALARAVARPADREHLLRAYESHVLLRLRQGRPEEAVATAQLFRAAWTQRGPLARLVDRPAVWGVLAYCPSPAPFLEARKHRLLLIESCRAALALRCHRERHRAWPARLTDLSPDLLSATPCDPFSGQVLDYRLEADQWTLRSQGPQPGSDHWLPSQVGADWFENPRRLVFASTDPRAFEEAWARRQSGYRLIRGASTDPFSATPEVSALRGLSLTEALQALSAGRSASTNAAAAASDATLPARPPASR